MTLTIIKLCLWILGEEVGVSKPSTSHASLSWGMGRGMEQIYRASFSVAGGQVRDQAGPSLHLCKGNRSGEK